MDLWVLMFTTFGANNLHCLFSQPKANHYKCIHRRKMVLITNQICFEFVSVRYKVTIHRDIFLKVWFWSSAEGPYVSHLIFRKVDCFSWNWGGSLRAPQLKDLPIWNQTFKRSVSFLQVWKPRHCSCYREEINNFWHMNDQIWMF